MAGTVVHWFFLVGTTLAALCWPNVNTEGDSALSGPKGLVLMNEKDMKRGWCKTVPIEQTIRVDGCLPLKVLNNYCYGQCNSMYIQDWSNEKPLFDLCAGCRPAKMHWKRVTLKCPDSAVKFRKHKYRHAKRCRCITMRLQ